MNQRIAIKERWGLDELEERNSELLSRAKQIWGYPVTEFKPAEKEFDFYTLDDEYIDFTGRDIVKYRLLAFEQPVSSWIDMFEHVLNYLHQQDKSVLLELAYNSDTSNILGNYVSKSENSLRKAVKIDENVFVERNTSTSTKLIILRRLFSIYGLEPMDLVFVLNTEMPVVDKLEETRRRYWAYALPIIQERNKQHVFFSSVGNSNSNILVGNLGISGFHLNCVANLEQVRIDLYFGNKKLDKNKEIFDKIYQHKTDIENTLGVSLQWDRADSNKASSISYSMDNVSIANEEDWPRIANFHADWSSNIYKSIFCYLFDETQQRKIQLAEILRDWTIKRYDINEHIEKCEKTYTRFTTDAMSEILPDIPGAPSGWNTDNHYFYEIINRTGNSVYIQLSISSKNATEDFLVLCDKINEYYPARTNKQNWQWRLPFRTSTVTFSEELSSDEIFAQLDKCFEEIRLFEKDLKMKLSGALSE